MLQVHWLHALIATISAVAVGLLTGLVVYFVAEPVGRRLEAGIAQWHAYKHRRHSTPNAAAVATMFEAPAPGPVSNECCDHDQQQHTLSEEQEVVNLQPSSFTSSTKDTADDSQPEDPIVMMTNPMLTGITAGLNSLQQTAAPAARAMRHTASLVSFARLDETCDIVGAAPPSDTHQVDGMGSYSMLRQHSRALSIMSQDMEPSHAASSTSLLYRTLSHVELAALSVPTASIATTDPEAVIQPMSAWNKVRAYLGRLADMELHVTLEYSVPHLGHTNSLMYGGLGKMVDIFVRCTDVPIALCAPMYAAFYKEDGKLDHLQLLISFELQVAGTAHKVDVYSTVCEDRVAYFLLQADIFRVKERESIHSFSRQVSLLACSPAIRCS